MNLYEFTVHLDRSPTDDELDAMYEAGLDDCSPVCSPTGPGYIMVSRHATSLAEAILTVVADIERAGFEATSIDAEDLLGLEAVASNTGRTYESVRLLALGKRGPGGFPRPVNAKGPALYSWAAVREWFRAHYGDDAVGPADKDADTLAAADLLLRARLLAPQMEELAALVQV